MPTTDFEVPLCAVEYVKANSDGLVIFDAHRPTNGCSRQRQRFQRLWIDRDLWLPHIDIPKMNLEEAACSWLLGECDPAQRQEGTALATETLPALAEHCLANGVSALYVVLDQYGCAVYFKDESGRLREHFIKRIHVDHVVDTTGCGGAFASGLALGNLKTNDYVRAGSYGNAAGARRCSGANLMVYMSLAETDRQIAEAYDQ